VADFISVVVATYNRPDTLDAVLRSLAHQSDSNFEVLVADDGSGPETAAVAANWQGRVGRRLTHVWQPDQGFRLAEIRNRALLIATGDYCIFLDGDCLARPRFIAAHRSLAERGWFVTGNRVLLSRDLTQAILRDQRQAERWSVPYWLAQRLTGRINRIAPLVSLPLGPLRKLRSQAWRGARACNLGVWRADLVAVDGFDGAFSGWGREDSDLFVRLMRAGVRRKDGRAATGVAHLWHPEPDRSALPDNERRLVDALAGGRIQAAQGMSALRDQRKTPTPVS
jgi:glycosyltransferase involved in cell wall biosynthesis